VVSARSILGIVCCIVVWLISVPGRAENPVEYNRDIRPILAGHCFRCHGPDSASREADLRLDQRDAAMEMGAIEPGDPEFSSLWERVATDDPDWVMPPPEIKNPLSDAQKELLRQWIAEGAVYEPHWSLIPPRRDALPDVQDEQWVRNPIDRFILAELEAAGLSPAPQADRRTLVRRLSLDLTGLPPDPELVESFVEDTRPDAYERLVDRLLASEQWGEHRGRYWLDAARYADTHGIHFDNYREIWAYRDWVIQALNRNLPFDQFTIEQLAGDLLPDPTLDQLIATGFNRCNITTNEGGVIPEEYAVLYTRDRTDTVAQVWLGMTAGCAVCHDHKFDPLSQREFYSLAAYFNNTTQNPMDGNVKDTPPVITVPQSEDRARWEALPDLLASAQRQVDARRESAEPDFQHWLSQATAESVADPREDLRWWIPLNDGPEHPVTAWDRGEASPATVSGVPQWQSGHVAQHALRASPDTEIELADAGDVEKDQPLAVAAWVRLEADSSSGAIVARMNDPDDFRGWDLWLEGNRVGCHLIHSWPENALKVVANDPLPSGQWTRVCVTYDGSGSAAGVKIYVDGRPKPVSVQADRLSETIRTSVPLKIGQRQASSRLDGLGLQDVRIYTRAPAADEVGRLARSGRLAFLLGQSAEARSDQDVASLREHWLETVDEVYQRARAELTALRQEESAIKARGTIAHVMRERGEPATAFVLHRGEYDQRRDEVAPDTPAALPPMPDDLPRNRLGFAQWLLRPENPLTARVTVNRFWQEVFGTGLVRTVEDFGVMGELPSHGELLDWLAIEFRDGGWDVKEFFRLLVTSATYQQAAITTAEKWERDPENRLFSRGPRFRLDAEMIRDYALSASGLLVPRIGGPSVKPYQPPGVWEAVAMIGSDTRDYVQDTGEDLYRRSLYTFWKRSAPPASLEIFNAPAREMCTVRRERTNTPLQALATLNDPQFVEAARVLAQRALREGGDSDVARANFIVARLLARPLTEREWDISRAILEQLLAFYESHPEAAGELLSVGETPPDASVVPSRLAAWTMLTNQWMNLDELLNK
jgi:hypothetical protein